MPELPEAERGRRLAEKHLVKKTLLRVKVMDDRIVYRGVSPRTFARNLQGRKVEKACRWGKYMWLEMDQGPCPIFHFGMSGSFHVYRIPKERPDHWKCEFQTDTGEYFAMNNPRRFGRIRLLENPRQEEPMSGLGFDPYIALPSLDLFAEQLKDRTGKIKAVLLDQSFAAGVGNWIADEILYQAHISPHRRANTLNQMELRRLRNSLRHVVSWAVKVNADYRKFPRTWLFHHRWRDNRHRSEIGKNRKRALRWDQVGGRTTAWIPGRQL